MIEVSTNCNQCENCRAYGSFNDKNGQRKDTLKWYFNYDHPDGGHFERETSEDCDDDVAIDCCMNCAQDNNFMLNGNPYYGMNWIVGENNQPIKHFITMEDCAENSAHIYGCRKHTFLSSFQIEDWSTKFPSDLQQKVIDIWHSWYDN
jgi:hypothetical protein